LKPGNALIEDLQGAIDALNGKKTVGDSMGNQINATLDAGEVPLNISYLN
jgi:hypothetical protein